MYVAKKTWFFWHAAVRRMPSDREHAFFQGGKSTSYEHVCLVTANSGPEKIRLARKLYADTSTSVTEGTQPVGQPAMRATDGIAQCASAGRAGVKPGACGAPRCGCGA